MTFNCDIIHTANGDAGVAGRDVAEHERAVPVGRRGDDRVSGAAGYVRACRRSHFASWQNYPSPTRTRSQLARYRDVVEGAVRVHFRHGVLSVERHHRHLVHLRRAGLKLDAAEAALLPDAVRVAAAAGKGRISGNVHSIDYDSISQLTPATANGCRPCRES